MKRTQTLKVSHPSRNGVIIADDTDTVLPNVDKNNKTIRISLKKHKEPSKPFYQYMKKDQNLPNKNIYSKNSSGKPLPATQIIQEINHHITPVIEVDRPNKIIYEISLKIDIVDRIVKITKIEINIHD